MSYYADSTVLAVNPAWSDNLAPLNQTKEKTRDDIRNIANLAVTLDGINTVTRAMNTVAELSLEALANIEANLAEHKTLEAQRSQIQSSSSWEGAAPLKKADVVEYDTSLLADKNLIVNQTQGINARMGQLEMEILVSLNLYQGSNGGRLYRS